MGGPSRIYARCLEQDVKVYVYADESGTFDKVHNELFVYGGVVLVGAGARDDAARRYSAEA